MTPDGRPIIERLRVPSNAMIATMDERPSHRG
jgi:hypothetical protein